VRLAPGTNLQQAVDARPVGTAFCLAPGTYANQMVHPKDGNTFVGEPGAILDGGGTTQFAFQGTTKNVTIRGLVVRNYTSPDQMGAIHPQAGGDHRLLGYNWVIEGNEITANSGLGVRICLECKLLRNNIHHNGQMGMGGVGDRALIEGNEVAYNNTRNVDAGWEAGASKFVLSQGLVIRDNYVHHNNGPGLWCDIACRDALLEGNRIEHNRDAGIFYEISYGAIIRNNTLVGNGFGPSGWYSAAAIINSASPNVEVYGNVLSGNRFNIIGQQQNRVDDMLYGPHLVQNFYVHDNTTIGGGMTGVVTDTGDNAIFTGRNNRFVANAYEATTKFAWNNGERTWSAWKSFGHDATGTYR